MEMYGRVWCVMRIPQIMGWWGIVLIQQTNVAEAELPFWRRGKELFPESRLSYNRSWGRCVGPVVIFFPRGVGDLTVLRFLHENTCQCEYKTE